MIVVSEGSPVSPKGGEGPPPSRSQSTAAVLVVKVGERKDEEKEAEALLSGGAKQGSFKNGREILSEADCYGSKTARYLSEAFGIKI